jgi:glyoxylase-like metal-dependent hydrolase (beta-lactamase superfamily II)
MLSAGPHQPLGSAIVDVVEEYTGHVEPGGPAAQRTLDALTITKISVGPMDNNAYLLVCRSTREALLIDAANDPERLSDLIGHGDDRPTLRTIVTTHQHQDHWGALGAVAGAYGANTIAHEADAKPLPVPPDVFVTQGDTVPVGDCVLEVIHLRGHTPGSLALLYRDPAGHGHLFTGDSLFPGGQGGQHVLRTSPA